VNQFDQLWLSLADELTDVLRRHRARIADLHISTKPDKTLLTEADLEVEELITNRIRTFDPDAVIIGEEDGRTDARDEVADEGRLLYVIDPIDGTAEFVRPDHREFCSVICVLQHYYPVAAFVLAPELGHDRSPLSIACDQPTGRLQVNGVEVGARASADGHGCASVTRSSGTGPRAFESQMTAAGYELKTRTTSQTLDMLRTAVDLTPYAGADYPQFDLFFRTNQKVWDGLAGLCLGETVGLRSSDSAGNSRIPVDTSILRTAEPTFDFTVLGLPEAVEWFLKIV
jgi:3'(2'), 5'-bisphosphate nucleotidase